MTAQARRPGAENLALVEVGADPAAVAEQIQIYAKDDAGVTQAFARASDGTIYQLTPPSTGGEVINELWGERITPHPADDEFNANALDASWSQTGFTALDFANRPAPYVNPVTNRASWENMRGPDNSSADALAINSWLRIQPNAGLGGIWKRLDTADFGGATPTNLLAWTRVRFGWRNADGVAAGEYDVGLTFFQESGAGFSFAVHATINMCNSIEGVVANVVKPLFWGRNGAVVQAITEGIRWNEAATNREQQPFFSGYLALQKIGATSYKATLIDDGGRLYMGEYANAGLAGINAVALWFRTAAGGGAGAQMFDVDFIRFYEDDDWLP